MAFSLKDIIYDFFGVRAKRNDINKDVDGKGFQQRYNELLAGDFDDNELLLLNELIERTSDPRTVVVALLPYLECNWGNNLVIDQSTSVKRKVQQYISRYYEIKGTKQGYEILFRMMGFDTVVLDEIFIDFGFDSPITFDDNERRFDGRCKPCTPYNITLTGSLPVTQELITYVYNIIRFNEPINARVRDVLYNGSLLVQNLISVFIDSLGDLNYNNDFDPQLTLVLDGNGDLQVTGPNAGNYSIDGNGDLIFTP